MSCLPAVSPAPLPSQATVAAHYDSLDPFYRDLWGEHVHHGLWTTGRETPAEAAVALSRRVLGSLALFPGAQVADIGCGYGGTARLAAGEHGVHVTGLTLSVAQKRYADAMAVARGSVDIRVQDWKDVSFPDASLDAGFAIESFEHIADKAGLARMMFRALRPGGRFALTTWLAAENVTRWSQRHLLDAIAREGRLAPLVTARELRAILAGAGFAELHTADLTAGVRRTWSVVLLRLAGRLLTRRDYRRFILNASAEDRVFALTSARIWLAFRTRCFRYGFSVWQRPP